MIIKSSMQGSARLIQWSDLAAERPELVVATTFPTLHRPQTILGELGEEGSIAVLRLPGAVVGPVGVIFEDRILVDDAHYVPSEWKQAPWLPFRLQEDTAYYSIDEITELPGKALYVDVLNGHRNFGHFVHDTLPYAVLQRTLETRAGLAASALLPAWRFRSQRVLSKFFFGKWVPRRGTWTRVAELILPARQFRLNNEGMSTPLRSPTSAFRELADRAPVIAHSHQGPPHGPPIYLRRAWGAFGEATALAGRDFMNGDEVDRWFQEHGFAFIDCSSAPLSAVLRRVAAAPLVAGLHGAQMAHILWAHPTATYVEMSGPNGCWASIQAVAESVGVPTSSVRATATSDGVYMDIRSLAETVEATLSSSRR